MRFTSRLIYTLSVVLVFIGLNFAQDSKSEANKFYKAGNESFKAGDFRAAIDNYNQALSFNEDYKILYFKGLAHLKLNELDSAQVTLRSALDLKPDFEPGYSALADVYFGQKSYNEAITNYQKVLDMTKDEKISQTVKARLAEAYNALGNEQLGQDSASTIGAIASFQKALEYKNFDQAYLSLSKAYTLRGDYDSALVAADNALKNRETVSEGAPYYMMGIIYKTKGDKEKAIEMFTKAKADPNFSDQVDKELAVLQNQEENGKKSQ